MIFLPALQVSRWLTIVDKPRWRSLLSVCLFALLWCRLTAMSTLLEIKSSMLRQVQNRQSFHHKTTVATASDSAQEISEMTSAVR